MILAERLRGVQLRSSNGIEFVGSYVLGYAGTTSAKEVSLISLTGGIATQPSEGDIVVCVVGASEFYGRGDAYLPTGYTQLYYGKATDTRIAKIRVCYKIMGSTPDTSLRIAGGTEDQDFAGVCGVMVFRGVDLTNPFNVSILTAAITNTAKPNPPAITPTTNGAIIVSGGVGAYASTGGGYTSSDLENFKTTYGSDDYDVSIGIGIKTWTSGTFDPAQFTFNTSDSTDNAAIGFSLALKPA